MEFGMFHEFQRVPGQTEEEAFTNSFEQVDAAERYGLDVMWLAELHTAPERSVLAAPLMLATAIAARTKRMKIGTAVQVLPLCHPLQLAEEVATVDHISHGRLIFGVGRSGFPRVYQAYGVSYAESRDRFTEVLEILKRAWTQERFSFDGKYYHFHDVYLVPKPYQKPYPEIRVAATSPDTYPAQRRDGQSDLLRHAARRSVGAGPEPEGVSRGVVRRRAPRQRQGLPARAGLCRADRGARPVGAGRKRDALLPLSRASASRSPRGWKARARSRTAPSAASGCSRSSYDEVLASKIIVGTPAQVVDRLGVLREELGLSGILAEMNCGSQIPHERVLTSLQLLCEEVIPKFKS